MRAFDLMAGFASFARESLPAMLSTYRSGYDVDGAIVAGSPEERHVLLRPRDGRDALALGLRWSEGSVPVLEPLALADDPDLPGARLAVDRRQLTRLVESSLATVHDVRVVAYRPRRRAVLKVAGEAAGTTRTVYVKLLRSRAFRKALRTFEGLPRLDRLQLVRPEITSHELACFVLPAAAGRSIHERRQRGEAVSWKAVRHALDGLHRLPAPGHVTVYGLEEERAAAHKLLERALDVRPDLAPLLDVVDAVALPPSSSRCWIHRDLHDKQIFVCGDTISLIDVEGASAGDPRSDVVNLQEHLRLRDLQVRGAPSESLPMGPDGDDPLTRRIRGLVRARLAGVYGRRPGWHGLASQLGRESLELLS